MRLAASRRETASAAWRPTRDAPIVLADEPTGELDRATGDGIARIFDRLHAEGTAVVVVTHDPSIATRAQRVLRMRDGRLESGSPA